MRAFAYLRKSTNQKDKQRLSLETQREEILKAQKLSEQHFGEPVTIVEWFEEKISGGDDNRPRFREMCDRFKKGEAQILLSWRLDRLSRNPIDSGEIMSAMQKKIIPYVQDSTRLYTRKDSGLLMGVLFGQASQELMEIEEKSRLGTNTLLKKGGVPFKVPFGAKNIKDKGVDIKDRVVIDPVESKFASQMFIMRSEGKSYKVIADWLQENGFKTVHGNRISKSTVEEWIKNPFYYGVIKWSGELFKHSYPQIVTKELWDLANSVGRGRVPRKKENVFPLKGMVKTSKNKIIMTASIAKKTHVYYHTYGVHKKIENVNIHENYIFDEFEKHLPNYIVPKSVIPLILSALNDEFKSRIEISQQRRSYLLGELTRTKNMTSRLIDLRMSGEISYEEMAEKKKEYIDQEVHLQQELARVTMDNESILEITQMSFELLTNLLECWKNADRIKKSAIIQAISFELFIDTKKQLIIKENPLFEGINFMNRTVWSGGPGSNRYLQGLKP